MATIKGGDRATSRLKEIKAQIAGGKKLRVGFLEKAKYPDGTPVALVAALNEFGHRARDGSLVGPWPFFRNMIAAKKEEWPRAFAIQLKNYNYNLMAAYKSMGEGIRSQLMESIRAIMAPPLRPSTIRRKGFSKPMIDTSHMLNSVDYEVTKK